MSLSPKVICITGCSSGLGLSLAKRLSQNHTVYATLRDLSKSNNLKNSSLKKIHLLQLDVLDPISIAEATKQIEKEQGRIDVLINNAGIMHIGFFEDVDDKRLEKVMDTNFYGVCRVIRAFLPLLKKSKAGKIINISSTSGRMAMPSLGAYAASKWALEGISESLRLELLPLGIQVLLIEPGLIDTPLLHQNLSYTLISGSPWEKKMQQLLKRFQKMDPKKFLKVEDVVDLIEKRINQKKPPFRTLISSLSKLKGFIRRFFPYGVYEKIILKVFQS